MAQIERSVNLSAKDFHEPLTCVEYTSEIFNSHFILEDYQVNAALIIGHQDHGMFQKLVDVGNPTVQVANTLIWQNSVDNRLFGIE